MNKYSFSTILSGILWGIISVFLKPLVGLGLTSIQVMFFRGALSALVLLVFLLIKDRALLKVAPRDLWTFLGTGVLSLTFFSLCYFTTIIEVGTSVAVILLYTSPIFILIFSRFLFKEKITLLKVAALVMTFAGCILVSGIAGGGSMTARGFIIGLGAGFGYALYSIFSRYALAKYSFFTVIFYTFVFSAVSILPFCGLVGAGEASGLSQAFTPHAGLLLAGISILCTVLPYFFYTYGLSGLETGKAAILVTVEPLVGTLVGFLLWKEEVSFAKVAGIVLILVAVILLGLPCHCERSEAIHE